MGESDERFGQERSGTGEILCIALSGSKQKGETTGPFEASDACFGRSEYPPVSGREKKGVKRSGRLTPHFLRLRLNCLHPLNYPPLQGFVAFVHRHNKVNCSCSTFSVNVPCVLLPPQRNGHHVFTRIDADPCSSNPWKNDDCWQLICSSAMS